MILAASALHRLAYRLFSSVLARVFGLAGITASVATAIAVLSQRHRSIDLFTTSLVVRLMSELCDLYVV